MNDLAYKAMIFAREAHKDQRRKYTDEPYFLHLAEVAGIVATVDDGIGPAIEVAFLHDTVEDCGITRVQLQDRFGYVVAYGVWCLSDTETGNRKQRKALARERLHDVPGWIQTIKVADLMSNTSSIVRHDPKFAPVYLEEARLMLDVLTRADPRLLAIARQQIENP